MADKEDDIELDSLEKKGKKSEAAKSKMFSSPAVTVCCSFTITVNLSTVDCFLPLRGRARGTGFSRTPPR